MKLKEKIKNKLNNFKANTARFNTLSLNEWLNDNGLEENAENRAKYTRYRLEIDEKNKQQDKNLSKFIGSALFLVVFLVIFCIMCANSVGAQSVVFQTAPITEYVQGEVFYGEILDLPYDYNITTFVNDFNGEWVYCYVVNEPRQLVESLQAYADGQTIDQTVCFDYFENFYNSPYSDVYDIGLDENNRALGLYLTCLEYITDLQNEFDNGFLDGYDEGERHGYDNGFIEGENHGLNTGEIAKKSIFAIFDAPIKLLTSLLNFEVFGINLLAIFKVIFTIIILGAIAKFVLSIAL